MCYFVWWLIVARTDLDGATRASAKQCLMSGMLHVSGDFAALFVSIVFSDVELSQCPAMHRYILGFHICNLIFTFISLDTGDASTFCIQFYIS